MAHAVSVSSFRSDHMSPPALALAVLLHALAALALWRMSLTAQLPQPEEAVEVTLEQPKPPVPPPTAAQESPPPARPSRRACVRPRR